jgi:hypothetical protein
MLALLANNKNMLARNQSYPIKVIGKVEVMQRFYNRPVGPTPTLGREGVRVGWL